MARVYLLDVSHLGSPHHPLPPPTLSVAAAPLSAAAQSPAPPLSWCCAAELAQWGSARAVGDAWRATAAPVSPSPSPHDVVAWADTAAAQHERDGYVRLPDRGADELDDGAATPPAPIPSTTSPEPCPSYVVHRFPSTVTVVNKYFGTHLELLAGAPVYGSAEDALTGLSRALTSCCRSSSEGGADGSAYGGVLLAHLAQDPALLPWHLLPHGGGGGGGGGACCCFHVVVVFCENAADVDADVDAGHAGASASPKERWRYFAVENGYECVFHGPLHPHPHAARGGASRAAHEDNDAGITLEVVDPACGRRSLLQTPLTGSSRLYQLLCNTLWPAQARHDTTASGTAAGPAAPTPDATTSANGFVVVGNDTAVMWDVLRCLECNASASSGAGAAQLRRRLRFFTSVVSATSSEATTGTAASAPAARVVLVNRYYAAVVQPRLVQTALFDSRMQELLDRFWEQNLARCHTAADESVCADAPAVVLWPPTLPSRSTPCGLAPHRRGRGGAASAVDVDSRAAYPPLDVILDALRRHGCPDVVVVVVTCACPTPPRASSPSPAQGSLTPYELHVCAARGVEVVEVCAACSDAPETSRAAAAAVSATAAQDAVPMPVMCDEEDTAATRGADRLNELLHCVQWKRTAAMPPSTTAAAHAPPMSTRENGNALLLLAYGQTPAEEEAWLRELLAALPTAPQPLRESGSGSTSSKTPPQHTPTTMSDGTYVRHAVPSVAAAMAEAAASTDAQTAPAAAVDLLVSTPYFEVRVAVHLVGGWWSWWSSHRTAPTPEPADWADAHDAFVLATSLAALRLEQARVASSSPGASAGDGGFSGRASLADVLYTLARKQREEWLGGAATEAGLPASLQNPTAAVDSPLLLLLLTDVTAADTVRAAEAEELIRRLTQPRHASHVAPNYEAGEAAEWWTPVELVFADPRGAAVEAVGNPGPAHDDFATDGTARVREAVEQHLWPHRTPASPTMTRAARRQPGARETASTFVPAPTTAVVHDADSEERRPAVTASCATADARAPAPALRTKAADEGTWAGPLIGCALPPGFLVDPETLRSVAVPAVRGVALASADATGPACGPDTAIAAPQPSEQALLMWSDKMKRFGHRLGEARRQEQAALLALALERVL